MEGARGAAALPPGPVEQGTLSLWMDLFSLDSVISYFDYSDLQLFAIFIFEVDFSETYLMTSAENSVLEPPRFWGEDTPRTPLQGSLVPLALAIRNGLHIFAIFALKLTLQKPSRFNNNNNNNNNNNTISILPFSSALKNKNISKKKIYY